MPLSSRLLILLAITGTTLLSNLQAGQIDAIYAFGDSLSDVGNIFTATGGTIPAPPYFHGQFSNGNVWVQDLASSLGLPALTPSLLGGTDYAFGSGQTGDTLFNTASAVDLLGATGQLAQYGSTHAAADPNALYTIWIGSNDLGAIPANATAQQIAADLAAIAGNVQTAINLLALAGAKNFLIVTVPDLGKTPESLQAGPLASAVASQVSASLDSAIANGSSALAAADSINISVLDTYSLLDTIVANPAAHGFTNVTDACLTGAVNFAGGTPCATPDQYLFWDETHPTAAADVVVADAALALVTPEPASISLIAAGLLGLGLVRRRHRRLD